MAKEISPLFALVMAVLLPEVVVIGLVCFGGLLFPWLAGLLARPFVGRSVSARLARDHVRTAVRTPAAIAAPILAISAIAGSLVVALSFTADWTTAMDRAQLHAPLVVETNGDRKAAVRLAEDPGIAVADPRTTITVGLGPEGDREEVEVVDVAAAEAARGLTRRPRLAGPHRRPAVAVTETYALDTGTGLGDRIRIQVGGRTMRPTVVAVVKDAPDLYADVLLPRGSSLGRRTRPCPTRSSWTRAASDVPALRRGHRRPGADLRGLDRRGRRADPGANDRTLGAARPGRPLRRHRDRQLRPHRRLPAPTTAAHPRAARRDPRPAAPDGGLGGRLGRRRGPLIRRCLVGFVGGLIRYATTRRHTRRRADGPVAPAVAIAVTCVGLRWSPRSPARACPSGRAPA